MMEATDKPLDRARLMPITRTDAKTGVLHAYCSINSPIKDKLFLKNSKHNLFTIGPDQLYVFEQVEIFLNRFNK